MADPHGFLKAGRENFTRRPVDLRLMDWKEVYEPFDPAKLHQQAARCMDCGIPFCHNGCPLGNLIPEWNDLTWREDWREAIDRLHATNNFPEATGRLCPAPCESACVLGINQDPVTIKNIEVSIIDRAFAEGWVQPQLAREKSGRKVAVVGSGPAGLAAAQQLTRAGHEVTVYERADRIGGLMRYGIPEFKMEKHILDQRLDQMRAEGTIFVTNVEVGGSRENAMSAEELRSQVDAIVMAGGSTRARDLPVPGRELKGIHQAMEYLPIANRVQQGDLAAPTITAEGKHVVIIGGGDTGADCLGTSHRQGAASVHQIEIMPRPGEARPTSQPWPLYPMIYRVASAHEEGGERVYAVNTERFLGDEDGNVRALRIHEVEMIDGKFEKVEGTDTELQADLVLLAMGFLGPETGAAEQLGLELDGRTNIAKDSTWQTSSQGVFVCGDMTRGQSLIVWAIAEGRSCAAAVDAFLCGRTTLPAPLPAVPSLAG